MVVHSFHIFDRKGKTLFTKSYTSKSQLNQDAEQLSEQRKLIFGMLFSLRELVGSLTPGGESQGVYSYVWPLVFYVHTTCTLQRLQPFMSYINQSINHSSIPLCTKIYLTEKLYNAYII